MRNKWIGLIVVLAPLLRADATLRYHTDVKTAAGVPGLPAGGGPELAGTRDMVVRIKGNKAYSAQGNLTSIMDLTTQDMTLIDTVHKRFAKVSASQYAEQVKRAIPAIPSEARAALASMKTSVDSRNTGRTATIQGIQSEEHVFLLTMDLPPGAPPGAGPLMKMLMQIWTAKAEEAQRVPALQEFQNYTASATASMNPMEMVKQVFSALPGLGDNLESMIADMSKSGSMSVRVHTEVTMPFLAAMAQQGVPLPPGFDAAAPVIQMNQELVELSTDAIDGALFEIPSDYQPATLEEILKGALPAPAAAAKPQPKVLAQ
jgi:hypothetical protein